MKQRTRFVTLLGIAAAGSAAWAGEPEVIEPEPVAACNWCDLITAPGKPIYENEDSWFINSFEFMGRFQFQTAYVDGEDVNGDSFSESFTDFRRVRLGAQMGFARYFKVKGNINLVADARQLGGDTMWEYVNFDELYGSFDIAKAFSINGFDSLSFNYGRRKVSMGYEVHTSSKKIKTVERSSIANRVYPIRMTGAWLKGAVGNWSGTVGVLTTDRTKDIANWEGGEAYYLNVNYELANEDELVFDFLYNDANGQDRDNQIATNQGSILYEWAFSAAWAGQRGKWGLMANAMIGDNGDNPSNNSDREGLFYGFVFLPTYALTEKFELVGRYAWQGAEDDEGIRTNGRYFRREAKHDADVNGGRGDSHHSIYGGLNYYICEDNMKIMTGVEWENLDTPEGDANAWTLWAAYRMYF